MSPRLEIKHLNKTFGSVQVLTNVELTVQPGELHGLAGQNGSGKSTLIKILTGFYTPDPGAEYRVDGNPLKLPVRWRDVRAAGISVVHQDLGLLDHLSVAENICVGGYPTDTLGRIDKRERNRLAGRTLHRLGVEIDPWTLVGALTAPQRAETAIARAMRDHATGAGLVILDEATRALSGDDLTRIHQLLRRIVADGSGVLMISHNLGELLEISDRMTILRDGRLAGAGLATDELTEQEIARLMLGGTLVATAARPTTQNAKPITVTVTGLSGKHVTNVDFAMGAGEILGITGLPGSGYEEIPYFLTGAQKATGGQLKTSLSTVNLARGSVSAALRAGVVLVPERRERDGLAFELSVRDNITLPALRRRGRPWHVGKGWQREQADRAVDSLGIRPSTPSTLVKELSGGNQQKVLLAKWLTWGPTVLVLHEPTQAVDVGARQDILQALRHAADAGMAVILVSSEPEDLATACDRVLIYGSHTGLREADATTPDALIRAIYATELATAGSQE